MFKREPRQVMPRSCALLALTIIFLMPCQYMLAAEPERVRYHNEGGRYDDQSFPVKLLALALSYDQSRDYEIISYQNHGVNEPRARRKMMTGDLDIMWVGSNPEFERQMLPVYMPIYKGLLGMRLFLIRASDQTSFTDIQKLSQLSRKTGLLGLNWGDIPIMAEAGLSLQTADFRHLYKMLANGRGDYFSRGITEIRNEYQTIRNIHPNLAIEREIGLFYKYPMFYFLPPAKRRLQLQILDGLKQAHADGQYDDLFANHPETKDIFRILGADKRLFFELKNHNLTDDANAIPAQYWINLDQGRLAASGQGS